MCSLLGAVVWVWLYVSLVGCRPRDKARENQPISAGTALQPSTRNTGSPKAAGPPKVVTPRRALNVLLITVDAMRADVILPGYARNIAPNLTKLSENSVSYDNAYSVSSSTAKSLASLMTGRYPSTLHRSGWFFAGYTQADAFIAKILHDHGVFTLSWQVNPYLIHARGLNQGFDVVKPVTSEVANAPQGKEVSSSAITALGIKLLDNADLSTKQFFAWTHYMDPHQDYIKHSECPNWGDQERDRYDSEICYTDLWLGRLFDWARQQSWWDNTALIVTSDHGECFGEHGMQHHAFELWQPLVRVPLLIRMPGAKPKRINAMRSQIDLAPTILELMGVKAPSAMTGRSFVSDVIDSAAPEDREPIILDLPEDTHEHYRRAIIVGKFKLISNGEPRSPLFDISDDPQELHDLSIEQHETWLGMTKRLAQVATSLRFVEPYGGMKLASGRIAQGSSGHGYRVGGGAD